MYKWEGFVRAEQNSPMVKVSSLDKGRPPYSRADSVQLDFFTPLSLRLANVRDGHAEVSEVANNIRLYNSKTLRGPAPLEDLHIGYLELPRIGAGFQGYQLVAFPGKNVDTLNEIPRGFVNPGNPDNLEFKFGNNSNAFQFAIDSLVPIGKVMISRARHATELQSELRQRLSLGLRQRRNLEASKELPEENAFLHAGDYIEGSRGGYSNLLVISGHLNK